jgi:integrase
VAGKRAHGDGTINSKTYSTGKIYWQAQWSYVDDTGKRRRTSRNFATAKLAREHLRLVTASITARTYVAPRKGTVGEWLELWMLSASFRDLAAQTKTAYRRHVRAMLPRIGHLQLQELTAGHLNAMYGELLVSGSHAGCCKKKKPCGSHVGAGGLSKASVRHHHHTLSAALSAAVRAKVGIQHAVTADAEPPTAKAAKAATARWTAWSRHEVRAFLEATREDAFGPIWHMLATTGCRRGEVLGMRWRDFDQDQESVVVIQTIGSDRENDEGERRVTVQHLPKGGNGRLIALDPGTVTMLRQQRKAYLADRLRFGERWNDNDLIFYRGMGGVRCQTPGAPLDGEAVSKRFIETLQCIGEAEDLRRIRLHDLRHTWATLALKAGENVKVVQERLGHAHPSITLALYAHVTEGMDRAAATKVAGLFS